MGYINTNELIRYLVSGEKIDSIKLLSGVDRNTVRRALSKSKAGLPRAFICTYDPVEEKNFSKMRLTDKHRLQRIYYRLRESRQESAKELPKLMALRSKYPNVPAIYNYIGLAYANIGKLDEYYQAIRETRDRFPDYLFGRVSLAEYSINQGRHKDVPAILSNKLEIYMHYPEDTIEYHVSEVRAFYSVVGTYYARSKKLAQAIRCYDLVHEADPEHLLARRLAGEIVRVELAEIQKKLRAVR